jgi:hypothetical protein
MPRSNVVFDARGNMYEGNTRCGNGWGVVWEIAP